MRFPTFTQILLCEKERCIINEDIKNVITLSLHLYGENITDIEKETARELLKANADNYDSLVKGVYFYKSLEELEDVVL